MGYCTASTLWPSVKPSKDIEELLDKFFSLVDNKADDAGQKLATEVFTIDGKFIAASGNFQGSSGTDYRQLIDIAKSRANAWKTVSSRRHELKKVYSNDGDGIDLILVGAVTIDRDASHQTHEFVARCLVQNSETRGPRIQHYQVLIPVLKESYIPLLSKENQ